MESTLIGALGVSFILYILDYNRQVVGGKRSRLCCYYYYSFNANIAFFRLSRQEYSCTPFFLLLKAFGNEHFQKHYWDMLLFNFKICLTFCVEINLSLLERIYHV